MLSSSLIRFNYHKLNSKKEIINHTSRIKELLEQESEKDLNRSAGYYHIVFDMINKFNSRIQKTDLIENLDSKWGYLVKFKISGISLELVCSDFQKITDHYIATTIKTQFKLLEVKSKFVSIEEYAQLLNVAEGAVRQWLRRGKIRSATKIGNEWRIPELTPKPSRGFTPAMYCWDEDLIGLPKEYEFLEGYNYLYIEQDYHDKKVYSVHLQKQNGGDEIIENSSYSASRNDIERLELFLISSEEIDNVEPMEVFNLEPRWNQYLTKQRRVMKDKKYDKKIGTEVE